MNYNDNEAQNPFQAWDRTTSCGHSALVPCHLKDRPEARSTLSVACQEVCGKVIEDCGHRCQAKCSECLSGKLIFIVLKCYLGVASQVLLWGQLKALAYAAAVKSFAHFQPSHDFRWSLDIRSKEKRSFFP